MLFFDVQSLVESPREPAGREHAFVSRLANADVSADVRKTLVGHDTDEAHASLVVFLKDQVRG
jgi:hypothetical protein